LDEHRHDLAIQKLRTNRKLTPKYLETLETVLWQQLGSHEDYIRAYGDKPVNQLVRQLVGLDKEAANEIFSDFLNEEKLNANQIRFVRMLVDYVVKNGFVENNKALMEDPFRSVGSVVSLFGGERTEMLRLMELVNGLKTNAKELEDAS